MGKFDITVYDLQSASNESTTLKQSVKALVDLKKLKKLINDAKNTELELENLKIKTQEKPTKEDIVTRYKFEFGWNVRFNQTNDQILFVDSDKVILVEYEYGKITYSKSVSPKLAMMIARFYGAKL
jgi:hypothetical protein